VKTMHQHRFMPISFSDVATLLEGIVEELVHNPCRFAYVCVFGTIIFFRLRPGSARPTGRRGCQSGGYSFEPSLCCIRCFCVYFGC
jgi:hypothetical protein